MRPFGMGARPRGTDFSPLKWLFSRRSADLSVMTWLLFHSPCCPVGEPRGADGELMTAGRDQPLFAGSGFLGRKNAGGRTPRSSSFLIHAPRAERSWVP